MTTETLYAGTLPLLEKQGSNWTAAYAWGSGQIRRNGEYPLTDAHGSSRTLTDANQGVTGTADYAAFGQVAGTTGTSAEPYLYAGAWGYRADGDAGLMRVGARYYDGQAGRFVTRDTLLGEHPYLYCEHEPVGSVDPSGHGVTLPPDPSGLPSGFKPIPHGGPYGGSRWEAPGGDGGIEFHPGKPGAPGWEGKDHWHILKPKPGKPGRWVTDPTHHLPGSAVDVGKQVVRGVAIGVIIYWVISEASRLVPIRNLVPVP